MEPEKKSSHGALIGSIIIVLVLIVGGIYLWQQKDKSTETLNQIQEEQNTNTELNNLEQEINSVDTNLDLNIDTVE